MDIKGFGRLSAATGIVLAAGSVATAVDYDVTGQAGQYAESVVPTVVRGTGGNFLDATVYIPWLIDADNGPLMNSAVVQTVGGAPLGGVTTFSSDIFPKFVAAIGSVDGTGQSNDGFILEGAANRSNSPGYMLPDGTFGWRANFDFSSQNNLESSVVNLSNTAAPTTQGTQVFNAASNTNSNLFMGTPSGVRNGTGDLLTGVTAFDGFTGAITRGVGVFTGSNNDPSTDASFEWLQDNTPVPTGETTSTVRQTQPELASVMSPSGAQQEYVCFGVGLSGGAAISGGSTEPIYFVVDLMDTNDGFTNAAYIHADGDGDLSTANNALKFVDHQATGGGTQPFVNSQFSMNSAGQVAAILRDETVTPNVFKVLVYSPIWNGAGDRIVGYNAPVEAARSGQDTIVDTFQQGAIPVTVTPIAGASISDNGRVAFTAITEANFDMVTGDLLNSTTDAFVWEPMTDTLHSIVRGGQNGTIVSDAFGANGGDVQLGFFPTDIQSDGFNRDGFSDDGDTLAINFRSGIENDALDGGILNPGGAENAVRGTITVSLGTFETSGIIDCNNNMVDDAMDIAMGTSDDCNMNGIPDECDIEADPSLDCNMNGVLDECEPDACPGDVTGDGFVNFDDLNVVLGNWNSMGNICDGDGTNDGFINFDDLNLVLGNWNTSCN